MATTMTMATTMDTTMDTSISLNECECSAMCRTKLAKLIAELYILYAKEKAHFKDMGSSYIFVSDYDFAIYCETGYDIDQLIAIGKYVVRRLNNPTKDEFKAIMAQHFSDSPEAITYKLFMAITILEKVVL